MRLAPRPLWLGLLGTTLAWVLLRPRRRRLHRADAGPQAPEDQPLINRPDAPRGARTVMALGALSALALVFGLAWYEYDQRAQNKAVVLALTHGSPDHAPDLITRYGCGGCHTVPGVPGADGKVGPDLSGLRERVYVGGVLRNTPDGLIHWIVDPQRFSPRSAMPATGITEAEARDVAAYLYAQ